MYQNNLHLQKITETVRKNEKHYTLLCKFYVWRGYTVFTLSLACIPITPIKPSRDQSNRHFSLEILLGTIEQQQQASHAIFLLIISLKVFTKYLQNKSSRVKTQSGKTNESISSSLYHISTYAQCIKPGFLSRWCW